ncbi:MAG TPA: BamA/TamA family outer membrane protein [Vicinamibacterales bacterium]|nr:BamA/TamA family outer membrane protein [Vicinamibacterales bacterium]
MALVRPSPVVLAAVALSIVLSAGSARADVISFLGRTLVDVRIEVNGAALVEPGIVQLIETRVGEPLSMERVRETIEHLVGLGRFEDIRVFAEGSSLRADGVALRWVLVPLQRIAVIELAGSLGFSAAELRTAIADRLGARPAASRASEVVTVLTDFYVQRGYRRPQIGTRLAAGSRTEVATLVVSIDPGARTVIDGAMVRGENVNSTAVLSALRLERGRPYDVPAIDARVQDYETGLRDAGYYEANVDVAATFSADGSTANVTVDVDRGPLVRVVFAGDPLPENRRDTLVPIRQERSVDLDLLEDASRNIAAFLRQQGYRAAAATYVREERSGEMVLTFTATRGPLHRLSAIDVVGNSAVADADILPLLPLEPGEAFADNRVATVAAAVTELYRVRGFARAVVKPEIVVQAEQTTGDAPFRPVTVRLMIAEGPRTTVGAVTIRGATQLSELRVRPLLGLIEGRPFYRPQLDADRDAVERLYQNEGFRSARVDAETALSGDGTVLEVKWNVREGPRTVVDHVLVSGTVRTNPDLVRREIALLPGQALGDDALIESQRRLAALGLFRRVRIIELPHGGLDAASPDPAQADAVATISRDVLIELEEAPSTTVSYGGGVEAGRRLRREGDQAQEQIELAPRGFLEISRRNLWGKNRSVTLLTRVSIRPRDPGVESTDPTDQGGYGFNEYRIVGTFREPRPFDATGDFQFTAFVEQAIRSSFNFNRRGVRGEYARRFGPALTVSGRYTFDRTRLFDEQIQPEVRLLVDRVFPRVRLSTLTGSVLRDSRDDVLDPTRGAVVGIDTAVAPRMIGSEVGFVKTSSQLFVYRRLPTRAAWTVAAGVRVGIAVGFERTVARRDEDGVPVLGPDGQPMVDVVDDVPASERFFAGGDSTVRGFVLDRLGTAQTLDDQGFPTGGNGLVVANVELRSPYWKGLGGVGFFDAGNVFRRASDISAVDMRPSAGFGVRYRSPLGPLRVDLGFNLDRRVLASGARERGTVFHISLGQAF